MKAMSVCELSPINIAKNARKGLMNYYMTNVLVFVFCRWHLIARTMPTPTVIKRFDVIKNIAAGFFPRSVNLFLYPLAFQ